MTSHRPLLVTGALAIALAVGVAACGVPLDTHPHAITRATVDPADVPPTTSASPGAQEVSVYFLRENRLEEVRYPVDGEATLGAAIRFALATPKDSSSLHTAVPPGTEVRAVDIRTGLARIDLTGEINDISGETQKQAFAQIVFTALSFPGVQRVRFLIDGRGVDAPTDNGNLTLVTANDYDPPLNPR